MVLFSVSGDTVAEIAPSSFQEQHREEDLQRWADENPHLLNNGFHMLSLGQEIVTTHNHSIDNLYVDGNGCLVVAELKRGKSPRDVTAQAIDYGAFASRLDWEQIDALCRERHGGTSLDDAYRSCFGFDLHKSSNPEHRLLIVAETFDPSVEDAAAYLNNTGVNLTLLAFRYFELNGERLLDVRVVLGEIPEQNRATSQPTTGGGETATDGYRNWLSRSIRNELPRLAKAKGISLNLGRGEIYFNFTPVPWPYPLGDCRFSIGINPRNIGIYFSFLNDRVPSGLYDAIAHMVAEGSNPYDPERLNVAEQWTTLSHSAPLPDMGSQKQVNAVLEEAFRMVDAIVPVVHSLEENAL